MSDSISVSNPSPFDAMQPFVQQYTPGVSLTLVLRTSVFDLGGFNTISYVPSVLNATYAYMNRDIIDYFFGLGVVEPPHEYPDLITGIPVVIQEEWILSQVTPYGYVISTVSDPKGATVYKYGYVTLTYSMPNNLPEPERKPINYPSHPLSSPPYPPKSVWGWPYPIFESGNCWEGVFFAIWNNNPSGHWRYGIAPEWLCLVSACPGLPEPYTDAFAEEVFDCFREAIASDGEPWYTPQRRFWISRNINDSWANTYEELKLRGGELHISPFNSGMRAWHWLGMANIPNRYWETNTEEHVDVKCHCPVPQNTPGKVYRKRVPPGGIIPPLIGLGGSILPALTGSGFLGVRLYTKKLNQMEDEER